jgi:hypothetical protein
MSCIRLVEKIIYLTSRVRNLDDVHKGRIPTSMLNGAQARLEVPTPCWIK